MITVIRAGTLPEDVRCEVVCFHCGGKFAFRRKYAVPNPNGDDTVGIHCPTLNCKSFLSLVVSNELKNETIR